jgi:hypothetical protein
MEMSRVELKNMTTAGNSTTPKMRMSAGPIQGSEASRSRPPTLRLPVPGSVPPGRGGGGGGPPPPPQKKGVAGAGAAGGRPRSGR